MEGGNLLHFLHPAAEETWLSSSLKTVNLTCATLHVCDLTKANTGTNPTGILPPLTEAALHVAMVTGKWQAMRRRRRRRRNVRRCVTQTMNR